MTFQKLPAFAALLTMLSVSSANAVLFQSSSPLPDDKMERIEVYGKKTTAQLEKIVVKAKFDFYETFNAYNDDPQFHMVCRVKAVTGSHIKRKQCQARYVSDAWARLTQAAYTNGLQPARIPNRDYVEFMLKKEHRKAEKKMVDVAMENPEVMQSLLEYMSLFERLENRREN